MSGVYRANVFKPGNWVALRRPKVLGRREGGELTLREVAGQVVAERVGHPPKLSDLAGIAGSMPGLNR